MLRVTRRTGERVIVGGDVVIEVLEIRGGTVRLGIDAPRSVPVYREELWVEIKRENERAAQAPDRLPELPADLTGPLPAGDPVPPLPEREPAPAPAGDPTGSADGGVDRILDVDARQ